MFTSDPLPKYEDLQGIYLVSSNTTNYELNGCSIQLLDASYETVAESEVLDEAANYLMRGPAGITSASGITISDATESYTNTSSETGALFSSPGDIVGWSDFSTYVDDVSLNGLFYQGFALTVDGDLNVTSVLYVSEINTTNEDLHVGGSVGIGASPIVGLLDVQGSDVDVTGQTYTIKLTNNTPAK